MANNRRKIRKTFLSNSRGFSLIEMAIVLVIIGILIGAVVKGKDLMKSAEQKKIYTKFFNEWRLAYLTFHDRTGKILGDTHDGTGAGQNGQADTTAGNGGGPSTAGRTALYTGDQTPTRAYLGLQQLGVEQITTNTANDWEYRYTDSTGVGHGMTIAFDYAGGRNFMRIYNMPAELAIALDTMVDGESDGTQGDLIWWSGGAATAWPIIPQNEADDARWYMQF